ncbi:MAG: UDP-N-acetylglucosamine--N-acetylmuramyl-(pentapeptide) pyrophosphoryl-undecaprenol N-acetylglucosamine transferase [Rhodoluna sp.]|jgi:UDP-N-acetylglucosamine--N-acetylmuramyl-(pentapeptide) pyrophosphoryl-undecaprenol N-acetylglucosamine transferase
MTNYLLAGGGTAGHVNPLLAFADVIMADDPGHQVFALGTKEGLEANLVPDRGYPLLIVDRLPMPRKINGYLFRFPTLFRKSVNRVEDYIKHHKIDVVVGFGGYASAPAYRAARKVGIPYVVHEANALAGYANRVGARHASAVAVSFTNTKLPNATLTGIPIRKQIVELDRQARRKEAAEFFKLDENGKTLLVVGGSLGSRRINQTIEQSRTALAAAGIQVLHIAGGRSELDPVDEKGYLRINYCERMDLALAMANFAVARAGAATVAEFAAVGMPAVYVPYPVGNGEQKYNVDDMVRANAGLVVNDSDFTQEYVLSRLIPLISNSKLSSEMAENARALGRRDGAEALLKLVNGVLRV